MLPSIRCSVRQRLALLHQLGVCDRQYAASDAEECEVTSQPYRRQNSCSRSDVRRTDLTWPKVTSILSAICGLHIPHRRRSRGSRLGVVLLANHRTVCRRQHSLITRCDQRTNLHGDYVEKQALVRFSHEKCYIE